MERSSLETVSDLASEVFVSPRVIDSDAFDEYSRELRQTIEQAGDEADRLENQADQAQRVLRELEEAKQSTRKRILALKQALDAVQTRADAIASKADEQAESLVDRLAVLEEHTTQIASRLTSIEDSKTEIQNASPPEPIERQADQTEPAVSPTQQDAIGGQDISALIEQSEALVQRVEDACSQVGEINKQTAIIRRQIDAVLLAAADRVDALDARCEDIISRAGLIGAALGGLDALAGSMENATPGKIELIRRIVREEIANTSQSKKKESGQI